MTVVIGEAVRSHGHG